MRPSRRGESTEQLDRSVDVERISRGSSRKGTRGQRKEAKEGRWIDTKEG